MMDPVLTCLALLSVVHPPAMGGEPAEDRCLAARIEAAGRLSRTMPDPGIGMGFLLPRARTELGVGEGGVGARMAVGAVRSAGAQSYIGVDGESMVAQVQVAEARVLMPVLGLGLAAGLVEDPWVQTHDAAWRFRAVAPGVGLGQGFFDSADLGGTLAWTSPGRWGTLTAHLVSGEGHRFRERNDGQNLSLLATLRPGEALPEGSVLDLSALYRDGSRGLASVPDHRLGLRLSGGWGPARGGVEWIQATGFGGERGTEPSALSLWATARGPGPLAALVRHDRVRWQPGVADSEGIDTWLGAGVGLPADGARHPARLLLLWQHHRDEPAATPLAGAAGQAVSDTVSLQLDVRLQGAVPLSARPNAGGPR